METTARTEVQDIIEGLCCLLKISYSRKNTAHLWGSVRSIHCIINIGGNSQGLTVMMHLVGMSAFLVITMKFKPSDSTKARMRDKSRAKMREEGTLGG